jgi:LysR family glycine cleavage system transcriptional activator
MVVVMNNNLPSLNSIKVFESAARNTSFKKAAEELHVTPTAVSHQIKALENSLGTLLFLRKTRAIELTEDGKRLAETASNILYQLMNTVNQISSHKNTLAVSTTSAFAAMWLVPNLSKFNQMYPEIEVTITTNEHINDFKKDRKVDCAIRYGIYDITSADSSLLITEEMGMYATPSYIEQLVSAKTVNLLETKWIRPESNLPEFTWSAILESKNVGKRQNNIRRFTQEHHIIQAALAGQGIALVSHLLVENALQQGWLVKCSHVKEAKEATGLSYYLVVPQYSSNNRSVVLFKNWLLDVLVST